MQTDLPSLSHEPRPHLFRIISLYPLARVVVNDLIAEIFQILPDHVEFVWVRHFARFSISQVVLQYHVRHHMHSPSFLVMFPAITAVPVLLAVCTCVQLPAIYKGDSCLLAQVLQMPLKRSVIQSENRRVLVYK